MQSAFDMLRLRFAGKGPCMCGFNDDEVSQPIKRPGSENGHWGIGADQGPGAGETGGSGRWRNRDGALPASGNQDMLNFDTLEDRMNIRSQRFVTGIRPDRRSAEVENCQTGARL